MMRLRLLLCVLLPLAAAVSSHAQWQKTSGPDSVSSLAYGQVILADVGGTPALFTGTTHGVFRSLDAGMNWSLVSQGLTTLDVRALVIIRDTLFAGTHGGGVFHSADGGGTWVAANVGLTTLNVHTLLVHGLDLYAGADGGNIFWSTDKGATWSSIGIGVTDLAVKGLAFYGVSLFAGTEGEGVFQSANNGSTWSAVTNGLTSLSIHALLSDGTSIYAGTDSGVHKLPPHAGSWNSGNIGGDTKLKVQAMASTITAADIPVFLFAGTQDSGVFVSDHGTDWNAVNAGLTDLNIRALGIQSNQFVFAATNQGVWRRSLSEMTTSIFGSPLRTQTNFRVDPSGLVGFHLMSPVRVTITAFAPSGRKITTLLSEGFSVGSYTRRINTAGLPEGLYVFRMQAGGYTTSRKVLLAR